MARARFALCPRGDTPTSTRPYDAIAYGAIPIIVSDHVWRMGMPFQCLVPYELMTMSIPEADIEQDASGALQRIVQQTTPATEKRMRKLLHHFRRDLLWRAEGSRVAENLLLEAARASTQWKPDAPTMQQCCPIIDRTV